MTLIQIKKYVLSAFEADKMFEALLGLNWLWLFLLSLLPPEITAGVVHTLFSSIDIQLVRIGIYGTLAFLHGIALTFDILRLRQVLLLINLSILLFIGFTYVLRIPISSGGGFIIICAVLCTLTFFRITLKR